MFPLSTVSSRMARTVFPLYLGLGTVPSVVRILNKNVSREGRRQGDREEKRKERGRKVIKRGRREGIRKLSLDPVSEAP